MAQRPEVIIMNKIVGMAAGSLQAITHAFRREKEETSQTGPVSFRSNSKNLSSSIRAGTRKSPLSLCNAGLFNLLPNDLQNREFERELLEIGDFQKGVCIV